MKIKWKVLIYCLVLVYCTAIIGSIFMQNQSNSEWYNSVKPSITPPGFIFPIVWTVLYFLIGISLYLASTNSKKKNKKKILVWFGINLFLNAIWTLFYFNLHNPILAFMDIILIELTIVYLIILTYRISRISSYLLIPYLIWVSFASVLTYLSI